MDDVTQPNVSGSEADPTSVVKKGKFAEPPADTEQGASQLELTQPSSAPVVLPNYSRAEPTHDAVPTVQQAIPPVPSWKPPAVPPPRYEQPYRPPQPAKASRSGARNWVFLLVAFTLLGAVIILSVGAFVGVKLISGLGVDATTTPTQAVAALPTATLVGVTATPTLGVDIQPWDGKQRFTILLMGLDKRPGEQGTAFRTDSMILLSIDPATKSIGMLSIPRDLFVEIPRDTVVRQAYGLQRVNSAYVIGELVSPGYGAKLAMQTVQYNLGIRVNDFIVYEFSAVIKAIDAVGGIDIDVPSVINDPQYPNMYYGYDPLYIPAGLQHMDGALALKYARTRHQTSDFDRAKRQQQVLTAMRDKILTLNMAASLIARAPQLWSDLGSSIHSGLTLDQLIRLALYAKDVPKANIKQGVIDSNYVQPVVWNGADVLVPNRASIGPLLVQIFGANYAQ